MPELYYITGNVNVFLEKKRIFYVNTFLLHQRNASGLYENVPNCGWSLQGGKDLPRRWDCEYFWVTLECLPLNQPTRVFLFCFLFFRMASSSRTCTTSRTHSPRARRWSHAWQLCVVVWEASAHLYHSEYKSCLLLTSRPWRSLSLQVPVFTALQGSCLDEDTV